MSDESKRTVIQALPAHDGGAQVSDPGPPPPSGYEFFAHAVSQIVAVRDSMTGEGGAITILSKSFDGIRKDMSRLHGDFTGLHNLASKTKLSNDANWETLRHELSGLKLTVSNLAISVTTFDTKLENVRAEVKEEIDAVRKEIAAVRNEVAVVHHDVGDLKQRMEMVESDEAVVR